MRLHTSIGSASVGGIRQLAVQIPIMDEILMGYWMVGQVRTMRVSVMYKSNLNMGYMILNRVLVIPCEVFFRAHLRNTSSITFLFGGRGIVDGLGGTL